MSENASLRGRCVRCPKLSALRNSTNKETRILLYHLSQLFRLLLKVEPQNLDLRSFHSLLLKMIFIIEPIHRIAGVLDI